jgi:hypothetical protein
MKTINLVIKLVFALIVLNSCKKDVIPTSALSSVTVINATTSDQTFAAAWSDSLLPFSIYPSLIAYGGYSEYGISTGVMPLMVVSSADTSIPLFMGKINLKAGKSYSLYITGQVKQVDTLLVEDNIMNYSDSLAGIRFVNLCSDSGPVSINLEGNPPSQAEFITIAYKKSTPMKTYSVQNNNTTYTFEIRSLSTGELLTTFNWNMPIHRNNTIVISGSIDPASNTPVQVFSINNY